MAYVEPNYKSMKDLKEAVKKGKKVLVFQPGGIFDLPKKKYHSIEGPHYPKPHTWYGVAEVDENNYVISVK